MKTAYQTVLLFLVLAAPSLSFPQNTAKPELVDVYYTGNDEVPYVHQETIQAIQPVPTAPVPNAPVPTTPVPVTPIIPVSASRSTAAAVPKPAPVQNNEKMSENENGGLEVGPAPVSHTVVAETAVTAVLASESAEAVVQPSATIAASDVTPAPAPVVNVAGGVMTVAITNHWPDPLSISYLNNAGSPSAIGSPQGAPLGTTTTVVYPTGWAGRIYVGNTINSADSKIEGSTTGANDIDVSYVDGYSVPITCSVGNTAVTGCNIDLWDVSGPCANGVGNKNVCLNPMVGVANGPSDPWFLPCQGAAYTFPNDNIANDGDTGTGTISCCIGTAAQGCTAAPARQGHGNNQASKAKRSFAEDLSIGAPSLLPKAHSHLKRHLKMAKGHGHGFARVLKDVV
ncbi:hypothetical protein MMC21_006764 [Puttea exsequens]|nr:hypothetical protein [Puttea exsequens]